MVDNIYPLNTPDPGVTAEPNWGNANHHALPPSERRARAKRMDERAKRWARAEAIRRDWTPEQLAEEEERLRAEIDEWAEAQRDAA